MRLLFLIHALAHGGAERVTCTLANHWSRKGWQVTIVTVASEPVDFYELNPAIRRLSLNLASEPSNALVGLWNNVRRIRMLRRTLRQVKPDVAVAMMTTVSILLAIAACGMSNMKVI